MDLHRATVATAGTVVRQNPLAAWDFLSPVVGAYYAPRVFMVGAESTGKTTLAARLADAFATTWVPEWARLYGDAEGFAADDWEKEDALFDLIALNQPLLEATLAEQCNRVLICDTDLLTTSIWHETYRRDDVADRERIVAAHERQRATFASATYLLSIDDTPWVQDGTRNRGSDDPNEVGSRPWFTRRLREELSARSETIVELRGGWDERFATASAVVNGLLC